MLESDSIPLGKKFILAPMGFVPAMTEERIFTVGSMGSPAAGNIGIIKLGDDALDANDTAELPGNPGNFPYERRFCRGRR
jgi:hypothetical protein